MNVKQKGQWLEIIVKYDDLLSSYLIKSLRASKPLIQQWLQTRTIKINDVFVTNNIKVVKGTKILLHLFPEEDYGVIPTYSDIDILFEDEHLIIVNKPSGIDTHPNNKEEKDTLANHLAFYYEMYGYRHKIRHIHRLDKDTSGTLIFAKHPLAQVILDKELEQKKISRTYIALVQGRMMKSSGRIVEKIGRDRHHPTRRRVSPTGKEAITNYEAIKYLKDKDLTVVKVRLETGRTHQIRVHMSYIGHPLAGDTLYGGITKFSTRQALHGWRVILTHPIDGSTIEVIAPLPLDFEKLIN
jgi:23S rRNA pseudouridine1911/1915/1917 synthase